MNARLARKLIEDCGALLLDFDGPMTTLLPAPHNSELAHATLAPLISSGVTFPPQLRDTTDHLQVLRWTAANSPIHLEEAESIATEGEVAAALRSAITDGLSTLLARHGRKTVVVTNNAAEAPKALLRRLGQREGAIPVCGRPPGHPELMKPAPNLVLLGAANARQPPAACVMVGDHASDMEAARAAGATGVGFAKTPRHARELRPTHLPAIFTGWAEVLE